MTKSLQPADVVVEQFLSDGRRDADDAGSFKKRALCLATKAGLAQQWGADSLALFCVMLGELDDNDGPHLVEFSNATLARLVGWQWKRLHRARKALIEAGWLIYVPGNGEWVGRYLLTIPSDVADSFVDDGYPSKERTRTELELLQEADWRKVSAELARLDLNEAEAESLVQMARQRGYERAEIRSLVKHWQQRLGELDVGRLVKRIQNWPPGTPINRGWPPSKIRRPRQTVEQPIAYATPIAAEVAGMTLREAYRRFILSEIQYTCAKNTLRANAGALVWWEKGTTNPPIAEVRRADFIALRTVMLAADLKPGSCNKVQRTITGFLKRFSEKWEGDAEPPLKRTPFFRKLPTPEKVPTDLNDAQLTRLFEAIGSVRLRMPGRLNVTDRVLAWRTALVMFVIYGPRTFDLLTGLTWDAVNFETQRVSIHQKKTGKCPNMPLHPVVGALLHALFPVTSAIGKSVLGFPKGTGDTKRKIYDDWHRIRDAAELPNLEIRDLRETSASIHVAMTGIEAAQAVLGHRPSGVTAIHYIARNRIVNQAVANFPIPTAFAASSS